MSLQFLFLVFVLPLFAQAQSDFQTAIAKGDFPQAKEIFQGDVKSALKGMSEEDFCIAFSGPEDLDFDLSLIVASNFLYNFPFNLSVEQLEGKYDFAKLLNCPVFYASEWGCVSLVALREGIQKDQLNFQSTFHGWYDHYGMTLPMTLAKLGLKSALTTFLLANPDLTLQSWEIGSVLLYIGGSTKLSTTEKDELTLKVLPRLTKDVLNMEYYNLLYHGLFRSAELVAFNTTVTPPPQISPRTQKYDAPLYQAFVGPRWRSASMERDTRFEDPTFYQLVKTLTLRGYKLTREEFQAIFKYNHYISGYQGNKYLPLVMYRPIIEAQTEFLTVVKTDGWEFMKGNSILHDVAASEVDLKDRKEFVTFILDKGLNINFPNAVTGETSLFAANDPEMVSHLLALGANWELKNNKGQTPEKAAKAKLNEGCRNAGVYCTNLKWKIQVLESCRKGRCIK